MSGAPGRNMRLHACPGLRHHGGANHTMESLMPFNLNDQPVEIPCPSCGKKFKEKLGRFDGKSEARCPHCQKVFRLEIANPGALRSVQGTLDKLSKAFKK